MRLFGLALHQSLGLIQSLRSLAKLDWRIPDFGPLSHRQRTQQVQQPYPRARIASRGRIPSSKEQQCATQRCGRAKGWGGGSGKNGTATTADAWWRPKCTA